MTDSPTAKSPIAHAVDIAINLGIVFLILAWCFQILVPFLHLVAWGGIIAIALNPVYRKLRAALGERHKTALTVIVIVAFAIVIVPLWLFTASLVETGLDLSNRIEAGTLTVSPPNDSVQDWPVIGERVYAVWSDASANVSAFFDEHQTQIRNIARRALSAIAGAGLGALQFLVSIIIAAALLANAESVTRGISRLLRRIAGDDGEPLRKMSVATIRSIAVGVLGIAAIQALGAGLGIALVGLPAVGLWTLIVLVVAIVQLPPWLVLFPLAFYVFSVESTTVAVIFLIWSIIVSFADMVLKPLLLGRGVDAPMIVILLGAIGGLLMSGIIGLFVGAVVLGLSYKLLQMWLGADSMPAADAERPAATAD